MDHVLLNKVLNLTKEGYVPPGPPAGAAPPMDPAAMGGGGMPMDPMAAMGGAPPPGGMPPMDPAAMGAMPPMDPAAMGGMPPMDPSMVGSLPPEGGMPPDPGMGNMQPIILNMEDLQAILAQAGGGDGAPEEEMREDGQPKRVTNRLLGERLDGVENMLAAVMTSLNIPMPEAPAMTEEVPVEEAPLPEMGGGMPGEAEAMLGGMPGGEPAAPIDIPPMAPEGGLMGGMPPMDPAAMSKMAAQEADRGRLLATLKQMNLYKSG